MVLSAVAEAEEHFRSQSPAEEREMLGSEEKDAIEDASNEDSDQRTEAKRPRLDKGVDFGFSVQFCRFLLDFIGERW
eukprot:CAMPEP_0116870028 /NCGR_PEP_ID=MMETSP0418-20121206/28076_1 /TAXON_ID=1158023 /ORGANISM="Astrosyne radiata, Strain 13vi08-1A" /LENGTH=76 /DNA_ID=CAMNT_0004506167 /DNA_START=63 /DNA_END=290 /DNA_ORIENTATION=-